MWALFVKSWPVLLVTAWAPSRNSSVFSPKNKPKFHKLATWGWTMRKGRMEFRDMLHYFIWIFPGSPWITLKQWKTWDTGMRSCFWVDTAWDTAGEEKAGRESDWNCAQPRPVPWQQCSVRYTFHLHLVRQHQGLNLALGSAHCTLPYGLRPFARNVVMYSVAKRNCTAQPKRRHLREPSELRLNHKFLSCCRERFPTTAFPLLTWTIPYCLGH